MTSRHRNLVLAAAIGVASGAFGSAYALPPGCESPPCGGGGGSGPPVVDEKASNNLSFPAIMSDGVSPDDFSVIYDSIDNNAFVEITDPSTQCTTGSPPDPLPIPTDRVCYWDGTTVWWLQQRTGNKWQALPAMDPNPVTDPGGTPVDVTGIDVGDLLESAVGIKSKQIRTEFTLLMDANTDTDFSGGVLDPFNPDYVSNSYQAYEMSGAVQGTDQSINEIQGTNYGPGFGDYPGTTQYVDPTTLKAALLPDGTSAGDVHATVYSRCARLVIQKLKPGPENLQWSSGVDDGTGRGGYWVGDILPPQVNIAAWDGSYSAEINASGTLIYGYNWNTKEIDQSIKAGWWRLTFVLEGGMTDDPDTSGKCPEALNTVFENTVAVNVGDRNAPVVLSPTAMEGIGAHHGEGGLIYIDVPLTGGGGGGGGGNKP